MKAMMNAAILAVPSVLLAGPPKPHHGDIGVSIVDDRLITSFVEGGGARVGLGAAERVFESELGSVEYGPFGNDEPGYTSNALPAGFNLGFNILSELKRWNGSAFDGSIAETMQIARFLGTPGEESRETSSGFVGGFLFASADENNFIDEHMSHVLQGAPVTRGFADPSDGVYLLELELFTDTPGIANSDPYWIVFNMNQSEADHEAAVDYVRNVIVPAPASALAMCLAPLCVRRRPRV